MRVREKRCTHIHILQSQTLFSGIKSDNNNNKVIRSSINNDANEMLHSDSNELCHPVCYMRYYGSKNMFDIEQHRHTHTIFLRLFGWMGRLAIYISLSGLTKRQRRPTK